MTQTLSPRGVAFLVHEEGIRLAKYLDSAGLPTIGIGHLLTPEELTTGQIAVHGVLVPWRPRLTRVQVMAIFDRDTDWFEDAVRRLVTVPLRQAQFDTLVSFVYNIGAERRGFKGSTCRRLLNTGDYASVPAQMSRWVNSGGKRDPVLVARRKRESTLWTRNY